MGKEIKLNANKIETCPLCGQSEDLSGSNESIVAEDIEKYEDAEEVCTACKEYQKMGIVFVGVDEKSSVDGEGHRSGELAVVDEKYVKYCMDIAKDAGDKTALEFFSKILEKRGGFIGAETARNLGIFPKEESNEEE